MPQTRYREDLAVGRNGQLADDGFHDIISGRVGGKISQVNACVITDPGDGVDMSLDIDGVTITVNTGVGNNAEQIADLLVAAINAEPLTNPRVVATATAPVGGFDLTARITGVGFDPTDGVPGANWTINAAAPANSTGIPLPFGRLAVGQVASDGVLDATDQLNTALTAQNFVLGFTVVNSFNYWVNIKTALGEGTFSFTSDGAALIAEITLGMQAAIDGGAIGGAYTVGAVDADPAVNITVNTRGLRAEITVGPNVTLTSTNGMDPTTDVNRMAMGVVVASHVVEMDGTDNNDLPPAYPAGDMAPLLRQGRMLIAPTVGGMQCLAVMTADGTDALEGEFVTLLATVQAEANAVLVNGASARGTRGALEVWGFNLSPTHGPA